MLTGQTHSSVGLPLSAQHPVRSTLRKKNPKVTEEKQVSKVSEMGMTCTCLRACVYVSVALPHTTQVELWPVAQQQVSTCHTFVYIG